MAHITSKLRLGIAIVAVVATAACSSTFRNHGYVPSEEELAEIVVGVDTRASVEDVIGTPSSASVLDEGNIYYVRSRVRNFAYQRPRIIDRQVLAISFDAGGVVSNIERFTLEDGRVIVLDRRVTESSVVDRVFLRQLLNNLGNLGGIGGLDS